MGSGHRLTAQDDMSHMTERAVRRLYASIAEPLGFVFDGTTRAGHWKWRHKATGQFVTVGGTKAAPRAFKNNVSQFRRIAASAETTVKVGN